MPSFKETDPTQSIVDDETFTWWVTGYRKAILEDPNTKRLRVDLTPESQLEGFNFLSIQQIPWIEIPQSLQEIIAMQYEAATQPDQNKNIAMELEGNTITFTLNSPGIHRDIDIYGENNVYSGVRLLMDPGKVQWELFKAPATLQSKLDTFNKTTKPNNDLIDYFRQLVSIVRTVDLAMTSMDTTLPQMHDVARLLVRERSRVLVTRLIVLPPPM